MSMSQNVVIEIHPSFKKKTDHHIIDQCIQSMIMKTTLQAERDCKVQAPIRTGDLRRGHSPDFGKNEGRVRNRQPYWTYVVHGTKRQKANNYPSRVLKSLSSRQYASKVFKQELRRKGVTG